MVISADELHELQHQPLHAEKDREFVCPHCNNRCTRSPNGDREYGHARGMHDPECPRYDEDNLEELALDEHNGGYLYEDVFGAVHCGRCNCGQDRDAEECSNCGVEFNSSVIRNE